MGQVNGIELFVFASLINWLVTTIFVESSLFAPMRDKVLRMGVVLKLKDGRLVSPTGQLNENLTREDIEAGQIIRKWYAEKAAMLVTCIMCLGVWVGFAEALYFGGPLGGWAAIVANGLLYKAGGHFIYELRSRIAKP